MLMGVSRGQFCSLVLNFEYCRLARLSYPWHCPPHYVPPPPSPARITASSSKQQACLTALHCMLLHDGFKLMETGVMSWILSM
jgi:hypothetical protein